MMTLQIKRHWFKMIVNGHKTEEYRAIKQFYNSRLGGPVQHSTIKFVNGYRPNSLYVTVEILSIGKGIPNPDWCDADMRDKECWVITLGKVLEVSYGG